MRTILISRKRYFLQDVPNYFGIFVTFAGQTFKATALHVIELAPP